MLCCVVLCCVATCSDGRVVKERIILIHFSYVGKEYLDWETDIGEFLGPGRGI